MIHHSSQHGMVLVVVLLLLTLMTVLVSHLALSIPLKIQLSVNSAHEIQQFQAAEAGLREGEKRLAHLLSSRDTSLADIPQLGPLAYAGYVVTLEVLRLPHAFCILPAKQIGHYYQVTASARREDRSNHNALIRLQSIIALPEGATCSNHKLMQRQVGRSAWCQLL